MTFALLFKPSTTPLEIIFLRPEVIEDQFPVLAKRSSDLLHGLDAGTHGLTAPLVEKLPGPGGRAVIPELLECFLEKVGPDGLQVVAEEIAQSEALLGLQILFPLEQEPARLFQERCPAFARHAARFSAADFVKSLVHFRDDMEPVENMQSLGTFFTDDLQVRLPHV